LFLPERFILINAINRSDSLFYRIFQETGSHFLKNAQGRFILIDAASRFGDRVPSFAFIMLYSKTTPRLQDNCFVLDLY